MNISRKTRYAVKALMELAYLSEQTGRPVRIREICRRQRISPRFLENIFSLLVKRGLLKGVKGKGGGFRLVLSPEKIRLDMVVETLENPLSGIDCLKAPGHCAQADDCVTRKIWEDFSDHIRVFFSKITLSDILASYRKSMTGNKPRSGRTRDPFGGHV